MAEFVMPTLGADMSAGTLVAWKKKPGDRVTRGEIIAEVDTDKAAIDVEVFTTGIIEKILVQPGEKVPVGTVLAIIREEGKPAAPPPVPAGAEVPPAPPTPVSPTKQFEPSEVEPGRLRISPSAKQLAAGLGVDPASVRGTGPGGAISREDIQRAAAAKAPAEKVAPSEIAADRQARMRQTIAAAMARSKREIPHYYLSSTIDMGRAMAWLNEENLKRPVAERLLYGVLLIKAVALALREVPELNAVWKEGRAVQGQAIHVGVAISLRGGGLVAPPCTRPTGRAWASSCRASAIS